MTVTMAKLILVVKQKEIAQLTCECEQHIGTQSDRMDQVLIFLSLFSISSGVI